MSSVFKDRLAKALEESGDSQKVAAEKIGVTRATVSSWLHGFQPRLPHYERAVEVYPQLAINREQPR